MQLSALLPSAWVVWQTWDKALSSDPGDLYLSIVNGFCHTSYTTVGRAFRWWWPLGPIDTQPIDTIVKAANRNLDRHFCGLTKLLTIWLHCISAIDRLTAGTVCPLYAKQLHPFLSTYTRGQDAQPQLWLQWMIVKNDYWRIRVSIRVSIIPRCLWISSLAVMSGFHLC